MQRKAEEIVKVAALYILLQWAVAVADGRMAADFIVPSLGLGLTFDLKSIFVILLKMVDTI